MYALHYCVPIFLIRYDDLLALRDIEEELKSLEDLTVVQLGDAIEADSGIFNVYIYNVLFNSVNEKVFFKLRHSF